MEFFVGYVVECSCMIADWFGQFAAARTPVGVLAILSDPIVHGSRT